MVRHENVGRRVEAVDEAANLFVHVGRHRTACARDAAARQPLFGSGQERPRDLHVVDGVEKAPEAGRVLVAIQVLAIDRRRYAPDALAVSVRREDRALGVREEGVLLRVEPVLQVLVERTDVGRIPGVDAVDDAEKVLEVPARMGALADFANFDGTHGEGVPRG